MCQETNEQGSNHRDPQLRTSPTSLNFRIFSRNQPKGPASQHTPESRNVLPMVAAFFFSFLMTYYMYALLLLVVSIDAGRDYRAPVQNRCSKGTLRPRSVSSPYPRLVLTPRFRLLFLLLLFRDMRTASEVWLRGCDTDAASGPPSSERVCSCSEAAWQHMKETEMVWGARHSRATSRQSCAVIKYLYRSHSLRCLLLSAAALRV